MSIESKKSEMIELSGTDLDEVTGGGFIEDVMATVDKYVGGVTGFKPFDHFFNSGAHYKS